MTRTELQQAVTRALAHVAPELEPSAIAADVPLRDQVDIDSMDFLRFVVELHKTLGVEVPEADYPMLTTLAGIVEYLAARLGPAAQ